MRPRYQIIWPRVITAAALLLVLVAGLVLLLQPAITPAAAHVWTMMALTVLVGWCLVWFGGEQ